jgi:hypothetical protein
MKKLATMLISVMTVFTSYVPAEAFPTPAISSAWGAGGAQQVQYRDPRYVPLHERRYSNPYDPRRFSKNGRFDRRLYDNRYRPTTPRPIIGGLPPGAIRGAPVDRGSNGCAARYRSYRASDNTYQPYSGPRRVCR